MNEITIQGSISPDGKFKSIFTDEVKAFLEKHKGQQVTMKVTILSEDGTILQDVYWKKVIVPALQKGLNDNGYDFSESEAEEYVKNCYPGDLDSQPNLDQYQHLIDWSIRLLATEFSIII